MDPLGSITAYFPFIDETTRDILETIMKQAERYSDFVDNLTQRVLDTTCSDLRGLFCHTSCCTAS